MRILTILLVILPLQLAMAAQNNTSTDDNKNSILHALQYENVLTEGKSVDNELDFKERLALKRLETEKIYVIIIAILSVVSLLVVLFLMKGSSPTASDIVLVMGLNFVIFGTIISVLIVNTSEQLSAITGILGAMGGYLFGSKGREELTKRLANRPNEQNRNEPTGL